MIMKLLEWALARLKEKSTWLGIAGAVAVVNPAIGAMIGTYGGTIGTVLAGVLIGATTRA